MGGRWWNEECAVMAVSLPRGTGTAASDVYYGLIGQQHRGQDGSGMVVQMPDGPHMRKHAGLVDAVYGNGWLAQRSDAGIGHNRYATQGPAEAINLQPHQARCAAGDLFLASNGDVTNFLPVRNALLRAGVRFLSENDGEVLAWYLAFAFDRLGSMEAAIRDLQQYVIGAYSAVVLLGDALYVFRDPHGFRPMVQTQLPDGGVAFASESVAFDPLKADRLTYCEVPAGAILRAEHGKVTVIAAGTANTAACVFELIYFSRPDSVCTFGHSVSLARRRIGWQLGREFLASSAGAYANGDAVIVRVPDSANAIAHGVHEALGVDTADGLVRHHTARRTFIQPSQNVRDDAVRRKYNPDPAAVEGRTVLLVDDSIVRGTTIAQIVHMLKRACAGTIHLLIGSPPIIGPCYMGIATPTQEELIANRMPVDAIAAQCGVDSLTYLSLAGLRSAVGPFTSWEREEFPAVVAQYQQAQPGTVRGQIAGRLAQASPDQHCYACFTRQYPVPTPDQFSV